MAGRRRDTQAELGRCPDHLVEGLSIIRVASSQGPIGVESVTGRSGHASATRAAEIRMSRDACCPFDAFRSGGLTSTALAGRNAMSGEGNLSLLQNAVASLSQ